MQILGRTSLAIQWTGVRLPLGDQVPPLVWEAEQEHTAEQLSPRTSRTQPAFQSQRAAGTEPATAQC